MEKPYVKILSFELELLGEIDKYTSLDFCRSWQGVGNFSLSVRGNVSGLSRGNIIMLGGDTHKAGIIRSFEQATDENGTVTTVSGQTLNGFTSQRIVLPLDNNGGYFSVPPQSAHRNVHAEEIIKTFLSYCLGTDAAANRRLVSNGRQMLTIAENQSRGFATEWGCRYPQLDEELQAICEYCDCGYEIYIDFSNRVYVAEYLPGVDRTVGNLYSNSPVILSRDFESVKDIRYSLDNSAYKNLAYAGGEGEGADRVVLAVTNDAVMPSGIQRFETFIDCGELQSIETDTAMSLQETAKHKLEEYDHAESLTASIAKSGAFRYGEQWDLGDLVTIRDKDMGLTQDIRISEVREVYEPGGSELTVTLGKAPKRIKRAIRSLKGEVR